MPAPFDEQALFNEYLGDVGLTPEVAPMQQPQIGAMQAAPMQQPEPVDPYQAVYDEFFGDTGLDTETTSGPITKKPTDWAQHVATMTGGTIGDDIPADLKRTMFGYEIPKKGIEAGVRGILREGTRFGEKAFFLMPDAINWGLSLAGLNPVEGSISDKVREKFTKPVFEEVFGQGVIDPQTPVEKHLDNFTNKFAQFAFGGWKRAFTGAAASQIARATSDHFKLGPTVGGTVETMPLLMAAFWPRESMTNVITENYNRAKQVADTARQAGQAIKVGGDAADKLNKAINPIGVEAFRAPRSLKAVVDFINEESQVGFKQSLRGFIPRLEFEAGDISEFIQQINNKWPKMDSSERAWAGNVIEAAKNLLKQAPKEFYEPWKIGSELSKGLHTNTMLERAVQELGLGGKGGWAKGILAGGIGGLIKGIATEGGSAMSALPGASLAAGGIGLAKLANATFKAATNPAFRRFYGKAVKDGLEAFDRMHGVSGAKAAPAFAKSFDMLESFLNKNGTKLFTQ